jgi:hypothetical protein
METLGWQTQPFDDSDWIYKIKHYGFRAVAISERGKMPL